MRYFSPVAEVPFCGHATIATGVAWAQRHGFGTLGLQTRAGFVRLEVSEDPGGQAPTATLTSVPPRTVAAAEEDLAEALATLGWEPDQLDALLPPRVAFAGAWHLVLAAGSAARLAELDYDFERLRRLMDQREWTTLQLVHRTGPASFRVRNPFPPGGVVEDPATGAAAAGARRLPARARPRPRARPRDRRARHRDGPSEPDHRGHPRAGELGHQGDRHSGRAAGRDGVSDAGDDPVSWLSD